MWLVVVVVMVVMVVAAVMGALQGARWVARAALASAVGRQVSGMQFVRGAGRAVLPVPILGSRRDLH